MTTTEASLASGLPPLDAVVCPKCRNGYHPTLPSCPSCGEPSGAAPAVSPDAPELPPEPPTSPGSPRLTLFQAAVRLADMEKQLYELWQQTKPIARAELSQRGTSEMGSTFASLNLVEKDLYGGFLGMRLVRMAIAHAAEVEAAALREARAAGKEEAGLLELVLAGVR